MILALDLSSTSTGVCFDGEHTHAGDTLTFGCPGCIRQRERDQMRARWQAMGDLDLLDVWLDRDQRGWLPGDLELLERLLIERSILTADLIPADDEEVA